MTRKKFDDYIEYMEYFGGGFVRALTNAWNHADSFNKRRLEDSFKYFEIYKKQFEEYKKQDD